MSAPERPFVCRRCGACCRATGEVRLAPGESAALAAALGLSEECLIARFTRLARDRRGLALTDRADGACVFLGLDNACRVQQAKPQQCRDYPTRWRSDLLDAACAARQTPGAGIARQTPGAVIGPSPEA